MKFGPTAYKAPLVSTALCLALGILASAARAESSLQSIPTTAAPEGYPPSQDIHYQVGGGLIYAPVFLGSKDYRLMAAPDIALQYKDKIFASVEQGIGYNLLNQGGWRLGPLAKMEFGRRENGYTPFNIDGKKTTALRGLGNVDSTVELGGFGSYTWHDVTSKAEILQGVNGDKGLKTEVSVSYARDVHKVLYTEGPPLIVSLTPHITMVDQTYDKAYFGINALQSTRSGLAQYHPSGGVLSYGLTDTAVLPITQSVTAVLMAAYDRLGNDAGDSPLVKYRGSPNQCFIGFFLTYNFGFDMR